MKKRIFLDTNIIYDHLSDRIPHNKFAAALISLAESEKIEIAVSALSFGSINFLLSKLIGKDETVIKLRKFRVVCIVIPFTDRIIDKSFISNFKDTEDAFQYYSALESNSLAIITRNKKDFKNSTIPVYSAEEYLKII